MGWLEDLAAGAPVPDGLATWASRIPSAVHAWEACERADWLIWLAARLPNLDDERRRWIARAALICARTDRSWKESVIDGFRPTHTAAEVAAVWAGRGRMRAPIDGGDWLVILTLAALTALPLMFVWRGGLGAWIAGAAACLPIYWGVRRATLARSLSVMDWSRAMAIALDEVRAGVADAGPRRRAAQAVVVRESLSFVRGRLAIVSEG